jgi:hypothetical protein
LRTIKDVFFDERHKAWCIHCSGVLVDLECNRDHAPSKSLLQRPYPDNLPVITVCKKCNAGFSRDEEYTVAALSAALSGSTDPQTQKIPSAVGILTSNPGLRTVIDRCRTSYRTVSGEDRSAWKPDLDRIKRIVLKNARGHAFFEIGEPMLDPPSYVNVFPLSALSDGELAEFEEVGWGGMWPEVGSRMMTRVITGEDLTDNGWVEVQPGVYRYAAVQHGIMTVRSVLYEYLGTEVRWGEDD